MSATRGRNRERRFMTEMNVIPYIDVMLVLLLIFMLTTPLLSQGVKVDLPKANAEALSFDKQKPLIVSVDAAGRLYLNTHSKPAEPLDPKELAIRVAAEVRLAERHGANQVVYVKGDGQAAYDKIMQAMVLLQKAGVGQVGLLTDPKVTV